MNRTGIGAIFAWIFIMIAGAMIIGLFFTIANSQADAGKQRLAETALRQVNTILTTQSTSYDVATSVPIPDSDIRLTCRAFLEQDTVRPLSQLDIGGLTRPLEDELITGQDLQTQELLLFSKEWRAPYRLGNILMVGSDDELLVLINNTAMAQNTKWLRELFPPEIPVETYESGTGYNARSYQNLRAVSISRPPAPQVGDYDVQDIFTNADDALYVHVTTEGDVREQGSVYYYEVSDNDVERHGPYHYVGEGMLVGLIWQADAIRASCLQHKLKRTLERQTQLQAQRLEALITEYGADSCANNYYTSVVTSLANAPTLNTQGTDAYDGEEHKVLYDYSSVAQEADEIRRLNEEILRGESCATIY